MAAVSEPEPGIGSKRSLGVATTHGQASNFALNAPLVVEESQKGRTNNYCVPISPLSSGGPYEFEIPPQGSSFLNGHSICLYGRCKIVKADGTAFADTINIAPVNMFGLTAWEKVEVILNNESSNGSSADYSNYKNYLETMLSYEGDARETHLRTQLFYLDTPGRMDTMKGTGIAAGEAINEGFRWRYNLCKASHEFDFFAPIATDILRSSKMIAPNIQVNIRLTPAPDKWMLNTRNTDSAYTVRFTELRLYYDRIILREQTPVADPEYYPFVKTIMSKYAIPPNMQTYHIRMQTGGVIPKQLVLFQVETRAAEGNYAKNPFNFKHFNLERLSLRVNGQEFPAQGYSPNFNSDPPLIMRELAGLYQNTGMFKTDRGCCVSATGFANGQTMFAFDLTPDRCNSFHLHRSETGTIDIELAWAFALVDPITVFVHAVYDAVYGHKANDRPFQLQYI